MLPVSATATNNSRSRKSNLKLAPRDECLEERAASGSSCIEVEQARSHATASSASERRSGAASPQPPRAIRQSCGHCEQLIRDMLFDEPRCRTKRPADDFELRELVLEHADVERLAQHPHTSRLREALFHFLLILSRGDDDRELRILLEQRLHDLVSIDVGQTQVQYGGRVSGHPDTGERGPAL